MQPLTENNLSNSADDKLLNKIGAFSALGVGIGYIFIMIFYGFAGGKTPDGGEASLKYLTGKTTFWWAIIWLSILTDILYLPVAFSLKKLFKSFNKVAVLLATTLFGLFVVLELVITWSNYSVLMTLSGSYNATTTEAQKTLYITIAEYISRHLTSPVLAFYAIFIPSLGVLIFSLVMLKANFGKITSYAGILSGIIGMVSVVGGLFNETLSSLIIPGSILALVWFLLVGTKLLILSK